MSRTNRFGATGARTREGFRSPRHDTRWHLARAALTLAVFALLIVGQRDAAAQESGDTAIEPSTATARNADVEGTPRSDAIDDVGGGDETDARQRLAMLQDLVGQWRGVGQLRRGSNRGSWIEQGDWQWQFAAEGPALEWTVADGKYVVAARLVPAEKPGTFELHLRATEAGDPAIYHGARGDDGTLVLAADDVAAEQPARITVRLVAGGDRLVVLFERRLGDAERYVRLAEVGYTRVGSQFGKGQSVPECIVTGGAGTIVVEHDGRTYYVCCSGCRDYFLADPEAVLADYAARRAEQ